MTFGTRIRSKYLVLSELQEKTIQWLKLYTEKDWGDETRDKLKQDIVKDLEPYRLKEAADLYRGMRWAYFDSYFKEMKYDLEDADLAILENLTRGDKVPPSQLMITSWTSNRRIANGFASDHGYFGIVLKAHFDPNDTILDSKQLPRALCSKLKLVCEEDEVLVKYQKHESEVVGMYYNETPIKSITEVWKKKKKKNS